MKHAEQNTLRKKDYEILAEFRYTLRKFLRFSAEAALKQQLTMQHYQALLSIEGYPNRNWVTMGELAERLQIAPHSAVGLVDRLENEKLACRECAEDDRRKIRISLTAQGRRALEKLYLVHREELKSIGPKLSELLHKLEKNLPKKR